jgi:hypothetical protein
MSQKTLSELLQMLAELGLPDEDFVRDLNEIRSSQSLLSTAGPSQNSAGRSSPSSSEGGGSPGDQPTVTGRAGGSFPEGV